MCVEASYKTAVKITTEQITDILISDKRLFMNENNLFPLHPRPMQCKIKQ